MRRNRPTGTRSEPLTAAGDSCFSVSSLVLATTLAHSLWPAMAASISSSGRLSWPALSLIVMAWEWHRMAPTRTHWPSIGTRASPFRFRILLASAMPFHSSLVCPFSMALSIHGISEPASGAPKLAVGKAGPCIAPVTARSRSRIEPPGSRSPGARATAPICATSSRMFAAPAPEAAWYVIDVIHSTHPFAKRPPRPMSMRLTVQLPPM
mmetsp:Transcript_122311/g.346786  ORF Transcript_122311/g.346786 Transcript_122311/m.346786 type:complete len:209 (+) Transcript_122311:429-1055(+)